MGPNDATPYLDQYDSAREAENSSIYTRQFYGNPYFFFPPPIIIPIVPFPPFFGRFPHRRRFW